MTRTLAQIIILLYVGASSLVAQETVHCGSFGTSISFYSTNNERLFTSLLEVNSDWKKKFNTNLGLKIITLGDDFAFSFSTSFRKNINKKTIFHSTLTLNSGDWQPNYVHQVGLIRKRNESTTIGASYTALFGFNRAPIHVVNASVLYNSDQNNYELKAFNEISQGNYLAPTLSASYIRTTGKENIYSIYGKVGYQNPTDIFISGNNRILFHRGIGAWIKQHYRKANFVIAGFDYSIYADNEGGQFSVTSFKLSFNPK